MHESYIASWEILEKVLVLSISELFQQFWLSEKSASKSCLILSPVAWLDVQHTVCIKVGPSA